MALEGEPESLDPPLPGGAIDSLVLSLFEGLTSLHPTTCEPMAALATHYQLSGSGTRYTFYLRGHPNPRGTRLPTSADLPTEYTRRCSAPPTTTAARWSDGRAITARDFVFSWRRALDPSLASPTAFLLHVVANAREVNAGKAKAEKLGIRAIDDFAFEVELEAPAQWFLEVASSRVACAVPQHVIGDFGKAWTDPAHMVSSGAFRLRDRRSYDRVVLEPNLLYYDSEQVAVRELVFLVLRDQGTLINLYRAGMVAVAWSTIPAVLPALRRMRDFQRHAFYASSFIAFNTASPPFNDVRVRYAFNMATDKQRIAALYGAGNTPARSVIPRSASYQPVEALQTDVDGINCDILAFDPGAARQQLRPVRERIPSTIRILSPNSPEAQLASQVLRSEWRMHLGIDLEITILDFPEWIARMIQGDFPHVAWSGSSAAYVDPMWFLDLFTTGNGYGTQWADREYSALVARAKDSSDPAQRTGTLAECEKRLLRAMPVMPMDHWVTADLIKPYVRGLGSNLLDRKQLKYAWIDTNWRPS